MVSSFRFESDERLRLALATAAAAVAVLLPFLTPTALEDALVDAVVVVDEFVAGNDPVR